MLGLPVWFWPLVYGAAIASVLYATLFAYGKVGPKTADWKVGKYDDCNAIERKLAFLRWLGPVILAVLGVVFLYDLGVMMIWR